MYLRHDVFLYCRHCLQEKENVIADLDIGRKELQRECQHLQARLDQKEKELTAEMHKTSNFCAE